MAEAPPNPPPDATDTLDLRNLAQTTQRVRTSAGYLTMRRLSSLGPIERTRVLVVQQKAVEHAGRVDKLKPGDTAGSLARMAEQLIDEEDQLIRLACPDVTDDQLLLLPAPERAGLLSAFFGAAPEEARQAVAGVAAVLDGMTAPLPDRPGGVKPRRGSRGSTAATRTNG